MNGFPTSTDIYVEKDGNKLAVVQSYSVRDCEPNLWYAIELSRLYITEIALSENILLCDIGDFSLVIVKPDRIVSYTGCNWSGIGEYTGHDGTALDRVMVIANSRTEEKR